MNNGQNHVEEFYDDFRKCKDYSYQMLKDSLIDISHLPVAETIEKINVYKLDGEDFKILVSSTLFPREMVIIQITYGLREERKQFLPV